jgi:hypothetical protein
MSILKNAKASRAARLGAVLTLAAASVVALSTSSEAASATLSPSYGPGWGPVTVGLSAPGLKSPSGKTNNVDLVQTVGVIYDGVYFSTAACAKTEGTSTAGSTAAAVSVDSPTHMVLTTPNLGVSVKTDYNLCVYTAAAVNATKPLLATAKFTAYPRPTVVASGVVPASGPTTGGQTITVEGTNYTSKTTATLGTVALTGIKVAKDGLSFTAVTPAAAAGAASLIVSDEGGASTAFVGYTYVNAITITPSTMPTGAMTNVTIKGYGFSTLTFVPSETAGGSDAANVHLITNSVNAHVYIVQNKYAGTNGYDGTNYAAAVNKANGQVGECLTPIVLNDTTLTCTLDTTDSYAAAAGAYTWSGADLPVGSYVVAVVNNGGVAAPTSVSAVTSGADITVAPF